MNIYCRDGGVMGLELNGLVYRRWMQAERCRWTNEECVTYT